jgi:hypothetical protein
VREALLEKQRPMPVPDRNLFQFITSIVPYWRVSDECWHLSDEAVFCGIGVHRNYGGQVMVRAWSRELEHELANLGASLEPLLNRIVIIVIDDADADHLSAVESAFAPILVLQWSHRESLRNILVNDSLD